MALHPTKIGVLKRGKLINLTFKNSRTAANYVMNLINNSNDLQIWDFKFIRCAGY